MHDVAIRKVSEMSPQQKAALEEILGRAIAGNEEISVVSLPPQQVAPSEDRAIIARKLEGLLNLRADKVKDIPEDEIDVIVDEAVHHARHHRR
ncbi:MAG: hypothetical protein ACKV22_03580 [Bryobacteraceae bacterium]